MPLSMLNATVKWTSSQTDEVKATIMSETEALLNSSGSEIALAQTMQGAADSSDEFDANSQLKRFIYIITALRLHEEFGGLKSAQISNLMEIGKAILFTNHISPTSSKLSFLHGELQLSISQIRAKEGQHWSAAWHQQLSHIYSKRSPAGGLGFQAYASAIRLMRQGDLVMTQKGLQLADELGIPDYLQSQRSILLCQCYRLQSDYAASAKILDELGAKKYLSEAAILEIQWERYLIDAYSSGDINNMVVAISRGKSHRYSTYFLDAFFWAHALPSKRWVDRIPKIATIKRSYAGSLKKNNHNGLYCEFAAIIERSYDNEIPIISRLEHLGNILSQVDELPSLEKKLLVLSASARWLLRSKQYMLATMTINEYKTTCMRISSGFDDDILNIFDKFEEKPWALFEKSVQLSQTTSGLSTLESLETSIFRRSKTLTTLCFKIALKKSKSKIRSVLSSQPLTQEQQEKEMLDVAKVVAETLGDLKGPIMKVGQMFSTFALGANNSLLDEISALEHTTSPVPASDIRTLLESELGKPVEQLFAEWDDTALAAASIGQVHKAKLHTGEDVVVKVQYPGIEKIVASDLKASRMLIPIYKKFFPSANVEAIFKETNKYINLECNYLNEARMQMLFRETVEENSGIKIPRVYHDYTTKKVLTQEYVDGQRLRDFAQTADPAEKDEVGIKIYSFFLKSFFNNGLMNGDPHPGNFLISDNGDVCMIDFGFSQQLPREHARSYAEFIAGVREGGHDHMLKYVQKIGIVDSIEGFDADWALKNALGLLDYGNTEITPMSKDWLMGFLRRSTVSSSNRSLVTLPTKSVLSFRGFFCLHSVLTVLEPNGMWGKIMHDLAVDSLNDLNQKNVS